jgi:hypothetical protein
MLGRERIVVVRRSIVPLISSRYDVGEYDEEFVVAGFDSLGRLSYGLYSAPFFLPY